MKCPCKDCICVPVCRHKITFRLIRQCELVDEFVRHNGAIEVYRILNLSSWGSLDNDTMQKLFNTANM